MRKIKLMMMFAAAAVLAVACGTKNEVKNEPAKMLVVYYSQTGNTKAVAQEIASRVGADMEEIIAVQPYDGDFQATIERCKQEMADSILPEIEPLKVDIANYDVVFVGYPVWFGTFAPPMKKFLAQTDLSGKKVVPFCTFGSGGLDSSVKDLAERQPQAEILPGYGVRAARMDAMPKEVDQFLKASGFIEGEYTQLEDFGEQHVVSEEESAIFDTAVYGYPMIHAKATAVASRPLPNGTEYLFSAANLPSEDKPAMGEIKVYVTVANGEKPVFTQVLR